MSAMLIRVSQLSYVYNTGTPLAIEALRGINLEIAQGEYVALVGHNGSGKSTLAKCLNGLLRPTAGEVWVNGLATHDPSALPEIRATVGLVLQHPDNQFVATEVEEEVAFGPENLGLPWAELRRRVDWALRETDLEALRGRDPRTLSAGQKARLAIAGILAMRPACLVLDEATAMLDPLSRQEVLALVRRLHGEGLTVVTITHRMEEVVWADRLVVLERGQVVLEGPPRQVLAQAELLEGLGLGLPPAAAVAQGLRRRGLPLAQALLTGEELAGALAVMRKESSVRRGLAAADGDGSALSAPAIGSSPRALRTDG